MANALLLAIALVSSNGIAADALTSQFAFFNQIKAYCGKAFLGTVVKGNASDDVMREKSLVMHVRECSDTELKIPFHIGDDRSRTWIISKTADGLQLKHAHRHQDGSSDKITMYGGSTLAKGSNDAQTFPADQYSKDMFIANSMSASTGNTWSIEIVPGKVYRYGLKREGREFVVEFDLTKLIATPPPALGFWMIFKKVIVWL